MNNLIQIQQEFQEQLLGSPSNFAQLVVKTKSPDVIQRIKIYAEAYAARLTEALESNYSYLAEYLGTRQFHKIAQAYVAKYPSNSPAIQHFGSKLPDFLLNNYKQRPVLAELARFEWAIGNTFDAPDHNPQTTDSLKNIPPENWANMQLKFHPSVQLHSFKYNITTLWDGLLNKQIKKFARLKQPQTIIFWRKDLETYYRILPELESQALGYALAGKSFAEICTIITQYIQADAAGNTAVQLLIQWLNSNLVTAITFGHYS